MRAGERQFREVGLEERQHRLRLRVAEAHVVLNEARTVGGEHESREDHAHVGGALGSEVVEYWLHELGDQFITTERNWCGRIGAHAAGVGSGVALTNAFVILCQGQRNSSRAVTQRE